MIDDRTLINTQKEAIFESIRLEELDPRQFRWEVVESSGTQRSDVEVSRLNHLSGFFFKFNSTRDGQLMFTCSPGLHGTRIESGKNVGWNAQLRSAQKWLSSLKREIEAPDPWAMIGEGVLETVGSEAENTPFTEAEKKRVSKDLEDIKQFLLQNENLQPGHKQFVEKQFALLEDRSKSFGRKDWMTLVLGVLIQTVLGLALQRDIAQPIGVQLIATAGETLRWVLEGPLVLPPTF